MTGVYVHIPFCRKACHYCDFHFSTNTRYVNQMVDAILKEIELRSDYLKDKNIGSVYFGGGTPSVLSKNQLKDILNKVSTYFDIHPEAEITLEANPDDLNREYLEGLWSIGVNRLSIGIQSFHQDDLESMNRSHSAAQAEECLYLAKEAGFSNITIDLIYGLPGTNHEKWQRNLEMVKQANVNHLSCYSLTIEPKTVFHHRAQKGELNLSSDEVYDEQYNMACASLNEMGFIHYEVSNFAKPGYEAVHNSAYWRGESYLGIGPAAHSYNGAERQWNISNNQRYIQEIEKGRVPYEKEVLTHKDKFNEMLMTALRTANGISKQDFKNWKDNIPLNLVEAEINKMIAEENLMEADGRIFIPEAKLYISDAIIARLFQ